MTENTGRIIRLTAENYKRLRAVEIVPGDAPVVEIRGRNSQGKTSVVDALWNALQNQAAKKVNPQPVRDGTDSATVTLTIDGVGEVTRTWQKDGRSNLTITAPDGAKVKSPQQLLDSMSGALSFEPTKFSEASPADQMKMLATAVDLGFDPDEHAVERKRLYDDRTAQNRVVRELEGHLTSLPEPPAGTPDTEVDVNDLLRQQREATEIHRRRDTARSKVDEHRREIERLNEALRVAKEHLGIWEDRAATVEDGPDLTDLAERIAASTQTNADVRRGVERERARERLNAARRAADSLERSIAELDEAKDAALAAADLPVPGLGITDTGVTLHGIPIQQASASERLRVAIGIGMALNPDLRIMRITDGSLLDADSMAIVAEMATANDFQVWVEVVSEDGSVGILIEDGQVAS